LVIKPPIAHASHTIHGYLLVEWNINSVEQIGLRREIFRK